MKKVLLYLALAISISIVSCASTESGPDYYKLIEGSWTSVACDQFDDEGNIYQTDHFAPGWEWTMTYGSDSIVTWHRDHSNDRQAIYRIITYKQAKLNGLIQSGEEKKIRNKVDDQQLLFLGEELLRGGSKVFEIVKVDPDTLVIHSLGWELNENIKWVKNNK